MLRLALLFFILAIIGLFFGFGIIANFAFGIAKICFIVFLILAVVMLLGSTRSAAGPPPRCDHFGHPLRT